MIGRTFERFLQQTGASTNGAIDECLHPIDAQPVAAESAHQSQASNGVEFLISDQHVDARRELPAACRSRIKPDVVGSNHRVRERRQSGGVEFVEGAVEANQSILEFRGWNEWMISRNRRTVQRK